MHISGLIFEFDLVLLLAEFRISYLVSRVSHTKSCEALFTSVCMELFFKLNSADILDSLKLCITCSKWILCEHYHCKMINKHKFMEIRNKYQILYFNLYLYLSSISSLITCKSLFMREYFCENILLFVWIKFRYKILRKMGLAYWTGCFILLFWMYFEWIVKSGQLLNKYVWYVALMISLRINLEDEKKNKQTANHNHQIDSCIIFFSVVRKYFIFHSQSEFTAVNCVILYLQYFILILIIVQLTFTHTHHLHICKWNP